MTRTDRAREFAQTHPKKTYIEVGSTRPFDCWVVIMSDFAKAEVDAERKRIAAYVKKHRDHRSKLEDCIDDIVKWIEGTEELEAENDGQD